jgi:hypothetical protein
MHLTNGSFPMNEWFENLEINKINLLFTHSHTGLVNMNAHDTCESMSSFDSIFATVELNMFL